MSNASKEKYVLLKEGYKVFTKTVGEGDIKLLTIHGGPGLTHECFANFPENLNPEGIQVILYDQLGSYYSDQPDDPSLWNKQRFVEELHQVVQALDLENHFVFANSWGAMVLIEYLLEYGTTFKGIVLSGMPASFQKFQHNITNLRAKLPQEVQMKLEEHEKKGTTTSTEYQQLIFVHWFNRHYCVLTPWPAPLMQSLQHLASPVLVSLFGTDIFQFNGPATNWDRSNDLHKIKTPTLLLAGKKDLVFEEDLTFMASLIPNAEYYLSPNGAHFCWWKDEKEVFEQLVKFIDSHRQC